MGLHNRSQAASNHEDVDVVIVGAGLSGLIVLVNSIKKDNAFTFLRREQQQVDA